MRIGYAKMGRAWNLDPKNWSTQGGDVDVWQCLERLALSRPQDEFVLVGRNSGEVPTGVGLPANVVNPWTEWRQNKLPNAAQDPAGVIAANDEMTGQTYESLDAIVVWAGQHGTSNMPIPVVGKGWEEVTSPHMSFISYCSPVIRGINRWRRDDPLRREEVWLMPDPRNYLKARDVKWPLRYPVLAQFNQERPYKHERFGDARSPEECGFKARWEGDHVWVAQQRMIYSGLELTALRSPDLLTFDVTNERRPFGILINENRRDCKNNRLDVMKRWVLVNFPGCPVYGKWTDPSLASLGHRIEPIPVSSVHATLSTWRSTLTTPASGSGWATAKPWEAFAAGTVCFFHPSYDTQGHIIPTKEMLKSGRYSEAFEHLVKWLRVDDPDELQKKVHHVAADDDTYHWLAIKQREYFEHMWKAGYVYDIIDRRLRDMVTT